MADRVDATYTILVDYHQAVALGAARIGAKQVGRNYFYRADETREIFRLTGMELASLGAGDLDERGSDYSLWCASTGALVRNPRRAVRDALCMIN